MSGVGIKAFAPASVANVACGYDVLGFALESPGDYVVARIAEEKRIEISRITGDGGKLPTDPSQNTAGVAVLALLDDLGGDLGIDLEIHKKMPFGSGLGSSAASAVAAVVAANKVLGSPYAKEDLLRFAVLGEQQADGAFHADNVAPSLLGGMILIQDTPSLSWHRVPTPTGLTVLVIHPKIKILTREAREIIKDRVTLHDHIVQSSNLASFILAMVNSNFDLIKACCKDIIIEPQRSALIPHFYALQKKARDAGALACSISGAGPSIFAFFQNTVEAEQAGTQMQDLLHRNRIDSEVFISGIDPIGAHIC